MVVKLYDERFTTLRAQEHHELRCHGMGEDSADFLLEQVDPRYAVESVMMALFVWRACERDFARAVDVLDEVRYPSLRRPWWALWTTRRGDRKRQQRRTDKQVEMLARYGLTVEECGLYTIIREDIDTRVTYAVKVLRICFTQVIELDRRLP